MLIKTVININDLPSETFVFPQFVRNVSVWLCECVCVLGSRCSMNFYCFELHGGKPVYWAVAEAKGQISPAINATKPTHTHTHMQLFSFTRPTCVAYVGMTLRRESHWFLLDLITLQRIHEHWQRCRNAILVMLWAGVWGQQRGGQLIDYDET